MTTAATVDREDPAHAGQAVYTRSFLSVYDAIVYGFNSPVLWRCPKSRLVEHYDAHVSARHLDIGVGTGVLLDAARFPVAAPETCEEFRQYVDEIVCLLTPEPFHAVGVWYANFEQTTDDEVRGLLEEARQHVVSS